MQIIECKKENNENFEFIQKDYNVWTLNIENLEKQELFYNFCINLLEKNNLIQPNSNKINFSDSDIGFLVKYFSLNNFNVKRRDLVLESKLKEALSVINKKNSDSLSRLVDEMTYHDQLKLASLIV